ncbi:MAG TPA: RNA polymerase sigma-70 factor [Paludibacteraceae bacterium]|jgi:RNA polymerase sigma-70 factor (ECF subfamily)|nr:RNA polymerase sigma-70 factor [Paludibacteraceae bacterium]
MNHDTEILIQPLKNGSVKAFDALYQLYSARLYNFVLKISNGDTYMAEEIVQRVFIKIWEERSLLDTQKSFNAFICTIAKNMLMNEYKHQMVEFVYQDYILQINKDESSDGVDKIEYVFLEKYLNTLIEQLTPARREVYIMNRIDKLTVKEIAQRSGKSEKTIEKQLSEANEFIRRQFSKHYDKLFSLLIIPFLV